MDIRKLKVGDRLRNNDPRIPDGDPRKVVTITDIDRTSFSEVEYQARTRKAYINHTRIFDDGKARAQGYNLVVDSYAFASTTIGADTAAKVAVEGVDPTEVDRMADDGAPVPEPKPIVLHPGIRVRIKEGHHSLFTGREGILVDHHTDRSLVDVWAVDFTGTADASLLPYLHKCEGRLKGRTGRYIFKKYIEVVQ